MTVAVVVVEEAAAVDGDDDTDDDGVMSRQNCPAKPVWGEQMGKQLKPVKFAISCIKLTELNTQLTTYLMLQNFVVYKMMVMMVVMEVWRGWQDGQPRYLTGSGNGKI